MRNPRIPYAPNALPENWSELSGLDFTDDPGETDQSFKDECDINTIVRRFGVTGLAPLAAQQPLYGDFPEAMTYHELMNIQRGVTEQFNSLPAELRKRFSNDAMFFADWMSDETNREEAESLGLVMASKPRNDLSPDLSTGPSERASPATNAERAGPVVKSGGQVADSPNPSPNPPSNT